MLLPHKLPYLGLVLECVVDDVEDRPYIAIHSSLRLMGHIKKTEQHFRGLSSAASRVILDWESLIRGWYATT